MLHTVPALCGSPHVIFLFHLYTLAHLRARVFPWGQPRLAGCTVQSKTTFLNINLCCALLFLSLSSSVVGGTTTQTGLGTCTLIVHMRTPALSAVLCLTPAALLFLERCVLFSVKPHDMHCVDKLIQKLHGKLPTVQ